jgi:hypothetical protein
LYGKTKVFLLSSCWSLRKGATSLPGGKHALFKGFISGQDQLTEVSTRREHSSGNDLALVWKALICNLYFKPFSKYE